MTLNSCPKCDRELPDGTLDECPFCGVILAKASASRPAPHRTGGEADLAPPPALGSGRETAYGSPGAREATYAGAVGGPGMSGSLRTVLLDGSPWIRLMAIFFLLGAGITLVSSFVTLGRSSLTSALGSGVFLMYLFIAGIYLYLGLILQSAGKAQKRAAQEESFLILEEALGYHTRYWRTLGILALVSVGLAVLGIAAAVGLGLFFGAGGGG